MLETQEYLGIVVEDLVDIFGRQAALADIVERLPVRLEGKQDRVVAPGHEVVGAERLPGAQQRRLGAVAYGVVIEAPSGHARALRQVRMLAWDLIVEPLEQHRDDATDMGNDIFDVRVAFWHAPGDQVQDDGAVLERGTDGDRESEIVDHG